MDKDRRIAESVPNFSEGRDPVIIGKIADEIGKIGGVRLLHVDRGEAANRTVITFAGEPEAVCEAAFQATKKAGQLIDMRRQHGTHPRIGATDVLPIVPVSGISLDECAILSQKLAKRIADEAHIPCYCYEAAALKPERRNLAFCRRGEYEAIPQKLADPERRPDFGYRPYDEGIARTGCSVVGARDFLIAVNFNLNTKSVDMAKAIAYDIRESGWPKKRTTSEPDNQPKLSMKSTKAIGWYIDEYGIAQVSMNLTDISAAPLHKVYEAVSLCANRRGVSVTGTEIIGLLPERVLLDAGRHFLRDVSAPKEQALEAAIRSMGLDDLRPFDPRQKVIEYLLE